MSINWCSKWPGICRYAVPELLFVPEFHTGNYQYRGVTLTTHSLLLPRSWMSRSYISSPPCAPISVLWNYVYSSVHTISVYISPFFWAYILVSLLRRIPAHLNFNFEHCWVPNLGDKIYEFYFSKYDQRTFFLRDKVTRVFVSLYRCCSYNCNVLTRNYSRMERGALHNYQMR